MLGARRKMEEIGFMKPGDQPYFYAGAPVFAMGFAEPPRGSIWDPISPTSAFAGHLAKAYVPGEDALLSGPMARTVYAAGTRKVTNMFGLICAVNGFAFWRDGLDEQGCLLYVLVNDGTRKLPEDPPCLTDLIKAAPPADAAARKAYEERVVRAATAQLFDNAMHIETSTVWSR
ncbi:MAG TPA: hypothetical protein VJ694_01795 [Patescibacteria group bacterium]|nr:hypothetical protein [Patescibacteria group bacterium]